jgi:hypothetical protein
MDSHLTLAVVGNLVCFLFGSVCVECLKAARNPGLKNSEADVKATQTRAWLGLGASLCGFGQLVMFGWLLLVVQTLIQRP